MITLTKEEEQWLASNRESYEMYLLHAMMHDSGRLNSFLTAGVVPQYFKTPAAMGVCAALKKASEMMRRLQSFVPTPPSREFLKTFLKAFHDTEELLDDKECEEALDLVDQLQSPDLKEYWIYLDHYFPTWFTNAAVKDTVRSTIAKPVIQVNELHSFIGRTISAANAAVYNADDDDMNEVFEGEDETPKNRRPTGIDGLDRCLNGGWGDSECYILFGGTGGGKSVVANQVAWFDASNEGSPLVISTELPVVENVSRMVSCAASVPISDIGDCLNVKQMLHKVSMSKPYLTGRVEEVLQTIRDRIWLKKIQPDQGASARAIMEQMLDNFITRMNRPPTLVVFDWLGRVADCGVGGKTSSSDRAAIWERAADGCVQFAEMTKIPVLVLAQGVPTCHHKRFLELDDIAISKGMTRNMVAAIGVTNTIDKAGIAAAARGDAPPTKKYLDDQFLCLVKARKGEGENIPVTRQFVYQRFVAKPKGNF